MYRYCNNNVPEIFRLYFSVNSDYHDYGTRTAMHMHIPPVRLDIAKTGIKYRGAVIWNAILHHHIYPDTSEAIFIRFVKQVIDII